MTLRLRQIYATRYTYAKKIDKTCIPYALTPPSPVTQNYAVVSVLLKIDNVITAHDCIWLYIGGMDSRWVILRFTIP